MKYIDEFRDGALAQRLASAIHAEVHANRQYRLMEFCGGHTHAISRYGLVALLPSNIQLIHGPGCPVCVLPIGRIDQAIQLALDHGVILCTYGDCMRVPASNGLSLLKAKALGADVRMVYAASDAVKMAQDNPGKEVVFLAIGFETTTPPTALAILQVQQLGLYNFSVLCHHVLTPPAINHILSAQAEGSHDGLDGFIGPAHVSTIIGSQPYDVFVQKYHKPVVISGFEPLDVLQAILMLVRQLNEGRSVTENEFTRAVSREGNRKAQALMAEVFELRPSFEWRGLGEIPYSALRLNDAHQSFDAEQKFGLVYVSVPDHKACECGAVLQGIKRPQACKIFGTICTPANPIGACMVSSEGACAAQYRYGRFPE